MLSRDKRPTVPPTGIIGARPVPAGHAPNVPIFNPATSHPAFLPIRVHVNAALASVPPSAIPQFSNVPRPDVTPREYWADPSKVSPAWDGWARGPAEAGKPRL